MVPGQELIPIRGVILEVLVNTLLKAKMLMIGLIIMIGITAAQKD